MSNSKALRTCTHINRNEWAPQTGQSVLRPPLCTTASALMNPLNPSVSSLQWLTFSCLNIWSVDFHPVDRGSHWDIYSWSSASSLFESPRLLQSSTSSQICCFCLLNMKALWKLNENPDSLTKNSHLTRCVGRGEKPWYKGHYLVFQLRVWKSENTTPQIKSITIF